MPRMNVWGDMGLHVDRALDGFGSGSIVLSYGLSLTAGGRDFLYSSLDGTALTLPRTGPVALQGTITELSLARLDLSGGGAAQIIDMLTVEGLSVNGADLFELVGRTASGVQVRFDRAEMERELNAGPWVIAGSDGTDLIAPGADIRLWGGDRISGQLGADVLSGGAGSDTVLGGYGADKIWGGDGADRLDGGQGADRLTGGAGADVFVFTRGSGADVIVDFRNGVDRIDISGPRVVRDAGADTIVQLGADSIRLVGMDRADIGWQDFI